MCLFKRFTTVWLAALLLGMVLPGAVYGQAIRMAPTGPTGPWQRMGGPIGGLGYDVRFAAYENTQVMYVTDNYSGVNKSVDGGLTWFPSNDGITARWGTSHDAIPVFSLTVDPNDPKKIWAGMKDVKGLYRSLDGGQNWFDVTPNIPDPEFVFRGITIRPGDSDEVFAAGELPTVNDGKTFNKVRGRVYRTLNGGLSWDMIWEGENLARYIILDPTDPNVAYISNGIFDREAADSDCIKDPPVQGSGGVWRGVNLGSHWEWIPMNNGLTDVYVGSLVMHPSNPDILLAGAGNNACSILSDGFHTGGVFLSENGGQTWNITLENDIITSVEFSPSDPDHIAYAGGRRFFYISEDGGRHWIKMAGQNFPWGPPGIVAGFPIDILVDPDDPFKLYANNYGGGNVLSTNGGANWSLASQGYTGALMFDVAVDQSNPAVVYATARSGTFRSLDGGKTWHGLTYPPAHLVESYAVELHPTNPKIVLASQEQGGELYRSTNGGFLWEKVYTSPYVTDTDPYDDQGFKRIVFAPSNPNLVYAGNCQMDSKLDNANYHSHGIFRSEDAGKTWVEANSPATKGQCVHDLAVHPSAPRLVYAATHTGGVFKTLDGGETWTSLGGPVAQVRSLAIHPVFPGILYAGTKGNGVYEYNEGTGKWVQWPSGMDANDDIFALEIEPGNPDVIWAGSNRTGVYRWNPGLGQWEHVNTDLTMRAITDLELSADGAVLYAATTGGGVYRLGVPPDIIPPQYLFLPFTRK